jgi:hypothetical protein
MECKNRRPGSSGMFELSPLDLGMKGDGQLIGRLIKVRRLPAMQDHHLRDSVEDQEA